AGIDLQIEAATKSRAEFVRTVRDLIAAYQKEMAAAALVKQRYEVFETERRNIDAVLTSVVSRAEGKMIEGEDEAKVKVQTGNATVAWLGDLFSDTLTETYPMLQGAYKLMRDVIRSEELAKTYINVRSAAELPAIEQDAQKVLKASATTARKLAGRMR